MFSFGQDSITYYFVIIKIQGKNNFVQFNNYYKIVDFARECKRPRYTMQYELYL